LVCPTGPNCASAGGKEFNGAPGVSYVGKRKVIFKYGTCDSNIRSKSNLDEFGLMLTEIY
jgi:hypothetical protein